MKYISNFKSFFSQAVISEGSNDSFASFDGEHRKTVSKRRLLMWVGKGNVVWMNDWVGSDLYSMRKIVRSVGARDDRINWHLLFVGFMIYESHFFFLNVQNWAAADQSDIKWVSEMNFLNCWTWSVIDTSRIATQPNDPIPSSLWISFCSLSLSRCCWRPRQRQIHGCRCKSIRLLAKWTIYLNKIPIIWWQWRR